MSRGQKQVLNELENTDCYFCGKNDSRIIFHVNGFRDDPRIFKAVKCNNCSLVYINPRYPKQENDRLYNDVYYAAPAFDPSGNVRSFITDKQRKINDHKIEIRRIKKYKQTGRILDFGCAVGFFLEALDGEWEKYALDISEFAISNIKTEEISKFCGTLFEARYKDKFFDVIYIGHTLDRLIDLKENIAELRRILKDDGIIYVVLPNIDSLCARVFMQNYRLLYSNHLIYFSRKTLGNFLKEAGLMIIETHHPFFKTSFFSWPGFFCGSVQIAIQAICNVLRVKTEMMSPPFRGNIMDVVVTKNNV